MRQFCKRGTSCYWEFRVLELILYDPCLVCSKSTWDQDVYIVAVTFRNCVLNEGVEWEWECISWFLNHDDNDDDDDGTHRGNKINCNAVQRHCLMQSLFCPGWPCLIAIRSSPYQVVPIIIIIIINIIIIKNIIIIIREGCREKKSYFYRLLPYRGGKNQGPNQKTKN